MRRLLRAKRRSALFGLSILAAIAASLFAAMASADDISNSLDATVDAVAEQMPLTAGGANATTRLYVVPQNGDGKNGCNLTGSTALTVSVSSDNPAVATVSPSSVTFTSCVAATSGPQLTVTPHSQGSATISVRQVSNTTGATFNLAPATFTVNVSPPPNTPPHVSVAGVTGGASYAKGSVPNANCQVTDAEDGNSFFPATLSAVTGPYASDGIGEQTASCSYTDAGGLTAAASETYGIIDSSVPTIGYSLEPASPNGDNGWYTSNVSLTWNVNESDSPSSLHKTDCVDQNITADQSATTYSCSASSAGGASATTEVTIKRDATKPTIQHASTAPNSDGWNNADVAVALTCTDDTSGIASCGPNKTLTDEGRHQSVTGDASDEAGNTASDTVSEINIDRHGPTAPTASFDESKAYTDSDGVDWFKDSVAVSYGGSTDPDLANGDTGSGVRSYSAANSLSSSGTLNYSGKATDKADNDSSATSGTVKVDADNPPLQVTGCPSAAVILGSSQSLSVTASDAESGLKTDPSGSVSLDTSSVGSHTKTVEAEDNVGHKVSKSCTYSVSFKFDGFYAPVDNGGVANAAKAGQAIPLKWRLQDASGNPVTNLASVKVTVMSLSCTPLGTTTDAIEEYAAGSSGLQNLGNGHYQFNWKSPSTYANSCKMLNLDLGEGSPRTARFKFTK